MSHLELDIEDGVATLVLANPPQNRIGDKAVGDLADALDSVARGGVRAVLVRAEGPDFSLGGDITPWPDMSVPELRAAFERYMWTFNQLERLPVPVVAAVQGRCFGGGLELAIRSDVIFAARSARFGHPEQTIGIVTLLGGVYRMAERVGRNRAMEWALTSEPIPAVELERIGVVNHVVDDDSLLEAASAFARRVAQGPTRAHAAHKALLRTWALGGTAAADEVMFDVAMPLWATADVQSALPAAVRALDAGQPRPAFEFQGA
jgi:enoyl-CoA hydratase/carnithine racemase